MGVRVLPSGRHQARVTYRGREYAAAWDTTKQAEAWIQRTRKELREGTFEGQSVEDPETGKPLSPVFREYAAQWVADRDLKPRTRADYTRMLDNFGAIDNTRLDQVTREIVKKWFTALKLGPTAKKHQYELLRAIFNSAVDDEFIDVSPVRIKGAARSSRVRLDSLPTPVQVHALADAMPTPKYRVMVLISAWCGTRFGESTELRRKDIVLDDDGTPVVVKVRRGVVRVDGEFIVGTPKSAAGVRDVTIPPHIRE